MVSARWMVISSLMRRLAPRSIPVIAGGRTRHRGEWSSCESPGREDKTPSNEDASGCHAPVLGSMSATSGADCMLPSLGAWHPGSRAPRRSWPVVLIERKLQRGYTMTRLEIRTILAGIAVAWPSGRMRRADGPAKDPTPPVAKVFRAGAYASDVSPLKLPVLINGGFLQDTSDTVRDPLHARCLVLDDGTTRIGIAVV